MLNFVVDMKPLVILKTICTYNLVRYTCNIDSYRQGGNQDRGCETLGDIEDNLYLQYTEPRAILWWFNKPVTLTPLQGGNFGIKPS